MAWLKYTPVFKHGYGAVGYKEIFDVAFLDDIKWSIRDEHGDPEGLCEPLWEIVEHIPFDLLCNRIEALQDNILASQSIAARYRKMIADGEYSD
ncbi:hypothetical protein D3C87_323630 [compost metagenome]